MSSSVIDYFAVLGRGSGPLQSEPFRNVWSDENNVITAEDVLNEAITDIAVLSAEQAVPDDTWTLLVATADDCQIEPPYIAVRRFADSKRLDYITDIKLVLPNEQIPEGYELVSGAHTGSDATSLLSRGFIAFKRANATDLRLWKSDPIIDDITFIKKSAGEELPERFLEIEVVPASQQFNHLHGRNAADISVVFHRRPGLGLCDLVYNSATTDRYPKTDHDKLELPVTGLPMFAFPHGMRLTLADAGQFPLPLFFTFVFTDSDGKHFYVACLQFYEQVHEADLQEVFCSVHGADKEVKIPEDKRIFCPKVICAVSQWPFYRAMRRFLRQLYSLSFSTLRCPLEYYIASVVHQVPFPLEGGRAFHVTLDVALISYTSKAMAPIEFRLPSPNGFPLMDVDFAGPLRCLSVDHLLAVYALMLRESKLLFVCESNTMLTEVMETLRALLFPLAWASCFVPRLPSALTGLLQAPGGFMIGIHIPSVEGTPTSAATAAYLRNLHSCRSCVHGTYVVDLTANAISQYSGKAFERLDAGKVENILKLLPFGPKFRLQSVLKKVSNEYSIGPQAINLSEFDSAFELQSAEGLVNAEKWENFPTLFVRDAFFAFLIDFLGDYSRYIIPPSPDLAADSYRTFQEEFAVTPYLDAADKPSRSTMELLLETQMFSALIQRRAEGRQQALVFFERAGALVRELGLSSGGHGWILPNRPAGEILELPLPVYGLLMADVQWAGLGLARQQQLRNSNITEAASPTTGGAPALSGRHHLTYLSTGTMNVLRGGALPMPYNSSAPVLNQRLDDLLTMWEVLCTPALPREKSQSIADAEHSEVQRAREEINLGVTELNLDNAAFGPLIIPGPCKTYSADATDGAAAKTFSYHTGWPALSSEYTDQALESAVNPVVKSLRSVRLNYEKQVGKDVLLLIRPPGQRLAFEQHGKLINPIRVALSEDILAAVSVLVDIASITLTLLSARTMQRTSPSSDVLQMLGVLAQLDHWELLPALSETAWRGVLLGCANAGGDVMRRICSIVYQLIPQATGQAPDSLTYGSYLRALASKKRHRGNLEPVSLGKANKSAPRIFSAPDASEAVIDPYLYLEEMGGTWYIQRSALQGQTLANADEARASSSSSAVNRSAPVSPLSGVTGAMSKHITLGKRFPVQLSFRSADNSPGDLAHAAGDKRPVSIKPEAAKLTSGQFSLADGPGMLVFSRPIALLALCPPRKVNEFTAASKGPQPGALSAELLNRMDQLYAGALPHIRRQPSDIAIKLENIRERNDSNTSAASTTSSMTSAGAGELSPVNPASGPSRIAQLSRRFFTIPGMSKSENTSPVPPSHEPKDTADQHAPPPVPQATSNAPSATHSPNPMMGWTKKLRPAMFFGSSPSAAPATPTTPRREDTELKVMSATLNFDDEDADADDSGEDETDSTAGEEKKNWGTLPGLAEGIAVEAEVQAAPEVVLPSEAAAVADLLDFSPDTESTVVAVEPTQPSALDEPVAPPVEAPAAVSEDASLEMSPLTPPSAPETLLDLDCDAVPVENESLLFPTEPEDASASVEEPSTPKEQATESEVTPVPDSPKPTKPVDVVLVQSQLLQAFEEEYISQGMVVGIYSFTPCASCGFAMLDEEIMARWCHGSGYEAHIKGHAKSKHARDMFAVHSITCKQCAEAFVPQLHVSCYSSSSKKDLIKSADSLACLWTEHVGYISPFGLRYELETLLMQHGQAAITTTWLHAHHPALLWGILWYSARVRLPSGLQHTNAIAGASSAAADLSYLHPVVVGWRECTVKSLAQRILTGQVYDFLTVRDIFPGCTEADALKLEREVLPVLDGSPAGMRIAMVAFCECDSVMEYGRRANLSVARLLNIGLLMMCYLYQKTVFTVPKLFTSLAHLNRDPLYEKIFVDAIKCVLSHVDLDKMRTSETELLAACASRSVVIVRNTLGFLY